MKLKEQKKKKKETSTRKKMKQETHQRRIKTMRKQGAFVHSCAQSCAVPNLWNTDTENRTCLPGQNCHKAHNLFLVIKWYRRRIGRCAEKKKLPNTSTLQTYTVILFRLILSIKNIIETSFQKQPLTLDSETDYSKLMHCLSKNRWQCKAANGYLNCFKVFQAIMVCKTDYINI